jgi:hypothetical protein
MDTRGKHDFAGKDDSTISGERRVAPVGVLAYRGGASRERLLLVISQAGTRPAAHGVPVGDGLKRRSLRFVQVAISPGLRSVELLMTLCMALSSLFPYFADADCWITIIRNELCLACSIRCRSPNKVPLLSRRAEILNLQAVPLDSNKALLLRWVQRESSGTTFGTSRLEVSVTQPGDNAICVVQFITSMNGAASSRLASAA